jgi:hypothetical protein
MTGSLPTGDAGSWAKTQPPSSSQARTSGLGVDGGAIDPSLRLGEIAAVVGVAAQEFDGEAGALKAV